jgi:iron complex outermembrane receptor protein
VTDNVNINARLMFSESASDSRYAGTPGISPTMSADNPNNPMPLIGFDPVDVAVLVRSVTNGTRDSHVDEQFTDMTLGLDGYMDVGRGWDWNINFQHNRNITTNAVQNLVNRNILQAIMDDGSLDYFNVNGNFDPDIQRQANHTGLYEAEIVRQSVDGYIRSELFDMPAGPVSAAFGFEVSNLDFDQLNDPETNALIIAGTAGGDNVSAGREVRTVFFESLFPLHDMFDLAVAARWDDYSDEGVGSAVSPQVGVTFRPLDNLLVRASYGEGFRAPSMTELYGALSEGFPSAVDLTGCANGTAPCTPVQFRVLYGGNPELGPEESKSWTIGVVWEPIDALAMEVSLYHTELDGLITTSTLRREFQAEFDGLPNFIPRGPGGGVGTISLQFQNFEGIETEGVDFNATYSLITDSAGLFWFTMEAAYVDKYDRKVFVDSPVEKLVDGMGRPDFRLNGGVQWSYNDFGATIQNHYISGQAQESSFCSSGVCSVGSHNEIDLQISYALPWDAELVLGARNLTDEEPEFNAEYYAWVPFEFTLYNTLGRVPYVRYTQSF